MKSSSFFLFLFFLNISPVAWGREETGLLFFFFFMPIRHDTDIMRVNHVEGFVSKCTELKIGLLSA